ncbi:MAG: hypothetical protein R2865_15815 [Deinococcales bacterium]
MAFYSPSCLLLYAPISALGSFTLTSFSARSLARLLNKLLKSPKSSLSSHEFVGLKGQAIYSISPEGGVAHVKDPYGNIHRLVCRSYEGMIAANHEILISEYVADKKFYYVVAV